MYFMMDNYAESVMSNNLCGHCDFEMKSALPFDGVESSEINPGDLLVCNACLGLNTVDQDANFIKADDEYLKNLPEAFLFEVEKVINIMKDKRKESNN